MLNSIWNPAFIRFDHLNAKEDNLQEIINDLTSLQRTDHVLIFDPSGRHQLDMASVSATTSGTNRYRIGGTDILYCRTLEEVRGIAAA